jgi:ribosomal-protein-alanine N-acetyltransferase
MTPPLTIRPLAYSDLPQVIAIERRSFTTPWSLAMFVLELSKPSGISLAAARGRHLQGFVICARYDEAWHVMSIAVDPPARRSGVAEALLVALFEQAGRDQAYTLEVRPSNTPAIALYERFGFRSVGVRPRYYADTGEDAIIMWRTADSVSTSGAARGRVP